MRTTFALSLINRQACPFIQRKQGKAVRWLLRSPSYFESTGQACGVRHIHRLDQDTTGAVLYAKNEWAHVLLDEAMRDKRIDRRYVALAEGVFQSKQGTIDEPIGKDRYISGKRRVSPSGDQAVTHYRVFRANEECSCRGT